MPQNKENGNGITKRQDISIHYIQREHIQGGLVSASVE